MKTDGYTHRPRSVFAHAVLITSALVLCAVNALAQNTAGSITGVVQDAQGAVIVGAKVAAFNQAQNAVNATVTTNAQGSFVFNPLAAGTYTISVEAAGFKSFSQKNVLLNVGDALGLPPIVMSIGAVSESVTVEANAVTLETVTATRSAVVDNTQIEELPIATRTNVSTAYLREVPGSNPENASNFNGQRTSEVVNQLDGVTMMDTGNNGSNFSYSVEAIGEVKVSTNGFTAEYGRSSGFQVASVLKTGTSSLHGEGYWFHKNEGLNANSYTNNEVGTQKPLSRAMLSGFNVGGPVYMPFGPLKKIGRNRLFWFTSFEFNPSKSNVQVKLTVPTAAQVAGNFAGVVNTVNGGAVTVIDPTTHAPFSGNIIPASRINAQGQALLNEIATKAPANISNQTQYNALYTLGVLPSRIWNDIYKADYNISDKHRVAFHLLRYHNNNASYGGLNTNTPNVDWDLFQHPQGEYSIAVNFVSILSPTMTNEFNWGRSYNFLPTSAPTGNSPYLKAGSPGWGAVTQLYGNADPTGLIPGFNFASSGVISNAPQFTPQGLPYINRNPVMDFNDNLTRVMGAHTIKAGIFLEFGIKYQTATADTSGTFNFAADTSNAGDTTWPFATALLGNFDTYTQASSFLNGAYHYHNYEWYLQDSWKAKPNLTINYGLRMEYLPPWFEGNNHVASFEPNLYDPKQAVTLYQPYCLTGNPCSGTNRVARNPITGATAPATYIGTEVPGSGNQFNGTTLAGKNGVPNALIDSRGIQWAPRIGFSWSPGGPNSKWVIRSGAGIAYTRIPGQTLFNQLGNPPNFVEASVYYGSFTGLTGSTPLQPVTQSTGVQQNAKTPTVYSWNFGIQRELPLRMLLDVAYVATASNHLLALYPYNPTPLGSAWLPQNQDPTLAVTSTTVLGANALAPNFYRPYLGLGGQVPLASNNSNGSVVGFNANSNYNGLQTSLKKRMSHGLQTNLNMTWSKALGVNSQEFNNGSTQPPFAAPLSFVNVKAVNYGPLSYDRRFSMNIDIVYNVPGLYNHNIFAKELLGGWQLSAIEGFNTGAPQIAAYTVQGVPQATLNQEITGSTDVTPRGVLVCNPTQSGPKTRFDYINLSCIQPAQKGSFGGDSGVGAFTTLGYSNWDISAMKRFALGNDNHRYMQFRFETYNAFNHTEWSGINLTPTFNAAGTAITNLATPAVGGTGAGYGALNAVRAARTVQLGARIFF